MSFKLYASSGALEISDIVANNTMGLCFQLMNVAMKVAEDKFRYDDALIIQ